MKKLDKLVLGAFWGPFLVTFAVTEFIFVTRFVLLYFDEIAGRDVGPTVYARLLLYFGLIAVPTSLPLSVLLASLMCFGNLGEFSELTAIKSAGISTWRFIRPVGVATVLIAGIVLWFNDRVQPWANLKGFSLLWDVKTTKATLDFKPGIFNNELPGLSIKVSDKSPDGRTLRRVLIYDHRQADGNRMVSIADSARMYFLHQGQYLVFELFSGHDYAEDTDKTPPNLNTTDFIRNGFGHKKIVVRMQGFRISRTDEEQFRSHAIMKSIGELQRDGDSLRSEYGRAVRGLMEQTPRYFTYHLSRPGTALQPGPWTDSLLRLPVPVYRRAELLGNAVAAARSRLSGIETDVLVMDERMKTLRKNDFEWHRKFTSALSCLVVFLIGAPLGSIIKRGGFGMPVLVAILFFILMYVLNTQGEKLAREGSLNVIAAAWLSDAVLLAFGLYFLSQASKDARLFEAEAYTRWLGRARSLWQSRSAVLKKNSDTAPLPEAP